MSQPSTTPHPPDDPLPNPEPASPSLPGPDPGVYRHEVPPATPTPETDPA